jgi:(p)ppGpp synthase/HD superfamily hydrolase|tara:strand:- start:33 stop:236 length:204 start_codon:yes stop_codon:yes gene_type:complete
MRNILRRKKKLHLGRAIELAKQHHKGQTDKVGKPYINHPLRVMNQMKSEDEKIVAVLHDIKVINDKT